MKKKNVTHNDLECLQQIQYRWKKEQQLIQRKYQIPYNMAFTFPRCHEKSISSSLTLESKPNRIIRNNSVEKRRDHTNEEERERALPPIFCSECRLNPLNCRCINGIGQWWIDLQKKSLSDRHIHFDESFTDNHSSLEQINSQKLQISSRKKQYVLLDWTNPLSLRQFLLRTQPNQTLANLSLKQLQELIINNDQIQIFDSIIDLILTCYKEQPELSCCQIYIDPSHYSTSENTIPFSQSHLLADNRNLSQTLISIQNLVNLLGIKYDLQLTEPLDKKMTAKQQKLILKQQISLIRSKVPYNTFRQTSIHTQQTLSSHSNN